MRNTGKPTYILFLEFGLLFMLAAGLSSGVGLVLAHALINDLPQGPGPLFIYTAFFAALFSGGPAILGFWMVSTISKIRPTLAVQKIALGVGLAIGLITLSYFGWDREAIKDFRYTVAFPLMPFGVSLWVFVKLADQKIKKGPQTF